MFSIFWKIVKYSILTLVFSYLITWLTFIIYHVYYGSAISLSYFLPSSALNLIMYSVIWLLLYTIYIFLYE